MLFEFRFEESLFISISSHVFVYLLIFRRIFASGASQILLLPYFLSPDCIYADGIEKFCPLAGDAFL